MQCPKCGMPMTCRKKLDERYNAFDPESIRRDRVCPGCGYRVITTQAKEKIYAVIQV